MTDNPPPGYSGSYLTQQQIVSDVQLLRRRVQAVESVVLLLAESMPEQSAELKQALLVLLERRAA